MYQDALNAMLVDRMYLTLVEAQVEADTFFPAIDASAWKTVSQTERQADERNAYNLVFTVLERRD